MSETHDVPSGLRQSTTHLVQFAGPWVAATVGVLLVLAFGMLIERLMGR